MKKILPIAIFLLPQFLPAQVFQKTFGSAAAQSLGGATLALPDLQTEFSNEAVLPLLEKKWLASAGAALPFSVGGWQANQFFAALRVDGGSGLALGFDNSKIENYGEQRWRLGYGRRLFSNVSVGLSLQVLQVWAAEYGSRSGATAAVSFLSRPFKKLTFAGRLQNPFFLKVNDLQLPATLQLGFAWLLSPAVRLAGELEKDLDRAVVFRFGAEYRQGSRWFFRTGVRTAPMRMAFGAGFKIWERLRLDFSSEWHPILGITPSAGVFWASKK